MAKAKQTKHTAAEIKAKERAALQNKGGGSAGMEDRRGGKAGHAKYKCPSCGIQMPDLKTGQIHWDAKHDKLGPYNAEAFVDVHAQVGGVTTQGVAVRGSTKKGKAGW